MPCLRENYLCPKDLHTQKELKKCADQTSSDNVKQLKRSAFAKQSNLYISAAVRAWNQKSVASKQS